MRKHEKGVQKLGKYIKLQSLNLYNNECDTFNTNNKH